MTIRPICGMSASKITYAIQPISDLSVTISRDPFVKCNKAKMLSYNYDTTIVRIYILDLITKQLECLRVCTLTSCLLMMYRLSLK